MPGEAEFGASPHKAITRKDLWTGRVETLWGTEAKCHLISAARVAAVPPGEHYRGREMPSFFIFFCNVERFIPRRAAAPFRPATTQRVSRRAPRM